MDAKKALLAKRPKVLLNQKGALSTGSTLLNLACTDDPYCGYIKGAYHFLVGDSSSGKTWLIMSCFAESQLNPAFKDYRLIFDNVENGALMDIEYYFGPKVAKKIEPPSYYKKYPRYSDTIESFYDHILALLDKKEPVIYWLDSQDALVSEPAIEKRKEQAEARAKGKEVKGSYGMDKAKYHSEHIREVMSSLKSSDSILGITGQTRDNIGFGFETKTRSGGKSLRFYATLEIWTAVGKKIKRRVRGRDMDIGIRALAEVKKNRFTGKVGKGRQVEIPIFNSHGIDDVGSCVDFLIEGGAWKQKKDDEDSVIYVVDDFLFQGTRNEIIDHVESKNFEHDLRKATAALWREIEDECVIERKPRYT